jgi:hypothetical protein
VEETTAVASSSSPKIICINCRRNDVTATHFQKLISDLKQGIKVADMFMPWGSGSRPTSSNDGKQERSRERNDGGGRNEL